MRHVMVDIETLGTRPGSVILSIGACEFDATGVQPGDYYQNIDVLSSLFAGLTVDDSTLEWWRKQDPNAIFDLGEEPMEIHSALESFARYLGSVPNTVCAWAKGPDFDLVMLSEAYRKLNIKLPWNFRNARDVRTVLSLFDLADTVPFVGLRHNALSDAKHQAKQVAAVYAGLGLKL